MSRSILFALALAACSAGHLRDERFATGSRTAVASKDYGSIYAVNVDEGSVSRLDLDGQRVSSVDVGGQPTRIARAGDRLFVSLRADRKLAVLHVEDDGPPTLEAFLLVGAEPYGVVASEDGKRVYVAVSLEDEVVEIDAESLETLRTWPVMDEPRWLALHPSGDTLFVASAHHARITSIDLTGAAPSSTLDVPVTTRNTLDGTVDLDPRVTGDLSIAPDGSELAIPVLYADTETPVESTDPTVDASGDGYGSSGFAQVSRINAALVTMPLDAHGVASPGQGVALFLSASVSGSRESQEIIARSYATGVSASPDGMDWAVPMEGSDAVLLVRRYPFKDGGAFTGETEVDFDTTGGSGAANTIPPTSADEAGFEQYPTAIVVAPGGPRTAVYVDDDTMWVHDFLARDAATIELVDVHSELHSDAAEGFDEFGHHSALPGIPLATSQLDPDQEAGRALFYSAIDARMAGVGAGVSCATCHFEGRADGLTWPVDGPRQTPSLAGQVSLTAPVTWEGDVDSVATEATLTTSERMGGEGLSARDAADIQAFVDSSPLPSSAQGDPAVIAQGKEIFERSDVGCASCHGGDRFTDNLEHPILPDLVANTPTLLGIGATAPYFHDGSAPDLRSVLVFARTGAMGDTSSLDDSDLTALETYLRSL